MSKRPIRKAGIAETQPMATGLQLFQPPENLCAVSSLSSKGAMDVASAPINEAHVEPRDAARLFLVPTNEASCILGKGGATVREPRMASSTKISLSGRNEYYPGTDLQ